MPCHSGDTLNQFSGRNTISLVKVALVFTPTNFSCIEDVDYKN